jgi:hypothetical protein
LKEASLLQLLFTKEYPISKESARKRDVRKYSDVRAGNSSDI